MSSASDFIIEKGILVKYIGPGGDVVIPECVTEIENDAFKNCRGLRSVVLPSRITALPRNIFINCTSLTAVSIPAGVTEIEDWAFCQCANLTAITLPEGLQSIGWCAFHGCIGLTEIVIPDTVTFLQKDAFTACRRLKNVVLPGKTIRMPSYSFLDCPQLSCIYAPRLSLTGMVIPRQKQAATIGYLCNQDAYDPALAEEYQAYAARQKKQIVPLLLADDRVAGIAAYAQMGKITKENVEKEFLQPAIEAGATNCIAFLMDWTAKNISPEDLQRQLLRELEKNPFNVADMQKLWSYEPRKDGTLEIIGYKGAETDVMIPPQIGKRRVSAIGPHAFDALKRGRLRRSARLLQSITSVTVPEGVTEIGLSAFSGCRSLTAVHLPSGLKSIPHDCFRGCDSLVRFTIPEGVKEIDSYAFYNCDSLTEIHIPSSVKKIKSSAFNCCWHLTVHAPAGSYAESYAKEKNIPFTEEKA